MTVPRPRRLFRLAALAVLAAVGSGLPPAATAAGLGLWGRETAGTTEPDDFPDRAKGRRALADGLNDAAETFFRSYREATDKREPAYTDATVCLLQACLRQKKIDAAVKVLAEHDAAATPLQDKDTQERLACWRGLLFLMQGRWQDARALLQPLSEKTEHKATRMAALGGLGDACSRLGDWKAAAAAYERHHRDFPKAPERLRISQGIFKCAVAAGDLPRAKQLLDELAPADNPAMPQLYGTLLLLAENKVQEAAAQYQEACRQPKTVDEPDFWFISSRLSDELRAAGKLDDAYAVLARGAAAAPTPVDLRQTRLRLADLLLARNRPDDAVAALDAFRKEFAGQPETVPAVLKLGELLRQSRNFLAAADRYGELAENPQAPAETRYQGSLQQALCLREAGQFAAAGKAFRRAAELAQSPQEKADALAQAADAAFAIREFAQAADAWEGAAAALPGSPLAEKALFNQALARSREGRFLPAARLFEQFAATHPRSELLMQARLERGIALRDGGRHADAIAALTAIPQDRPEDALAPQALLEAEQAAFAAGDRAQAAALLTRLLAEYPASPLAPQALYQRTHLAFLAADFTAATADARLFLEKFPQSPLTADILMWLGDHQISTGHAAEGEASYMELVNRQPASPLAPQALLAAARSALLRQDTDRADLLAGQLLRDYATTAAPEIVAQAELLRGDILAGLGRFADAIPHFQKALDAAPQSRFAVQARGRIGDMHYSLGDSGAEHLTLARDSFAAIAADATAPADAREKARYRLAKTQERRNETAAAIQDYLDIVYQYEADLQAGKTRDGYYFARAGFDAARLLVLGERYLEAARIYERLAAARIPESAEAGAKAREIRAAHHLGN